MLIAKSSWFKRRKYGGWGLTPNTWQGWLYITIIIGVFTLFQALPFWDDTIRMTATIIWLVFLFVDLTPLMIAVKKDELEYKIEAIAERNAAWAMSLILVFGLLYESILASMEGEIYINWIIATALIGGATIKSITNLYLEKKGLSNETKK
jgi:hypothetical protein